jgi:preprotein translocase subunit SecA
MVLDIFSKFFGTKHERDVRKIWPLVGDINAAAEELRAISEDELKAKTAAFKKRLADGETPDDLLIEAFAVVKETCRRLCGRTWDVVGIPVTWDMVPW